jgi:hypothetical protein
VKREGGETFDIIARCRIDTYNELEYYRSGGILHYVLRNLGKLSTVDFLVEVVGWSGALLILLAYLLLSMERLTSQSAVYQWMNVVGAAGFTVNGWWHGALPSASLNVIWMLIGGVALWRIAQRKGSSTSAM